MEKFEHFKSVVGAKADSKNLTTGELEESLKSRYSKYYGTPMWADLAESTKNKNKKKRKQKKIPGLHDKDSEEEESDEESEDDVMQSTTGDILLKQESFRSLPRTHLDIKACTDANKEEPHGVNFILILLLLLLIIY